MVIAWGRAASCHVQSISIVLNRAMRCLNVNELLTSEVSIVYKTLKILQLQDIYHLEVRKTLSYLLCLIILNSLQMFIRITYTRQIKARQFILLKARSNSCAKIIKYSAIEIWSRIPIETKIKRA